MGIDVLLDWFGQHVYLALLAGIALETAGLPLPGEVLLLAAGVVVGQGEVKLLGVLTVASLAALAGDTTWYVAGRRGGFRLLSLYCRISLGSGQCVGRTQAYFSRFGPATVLLARLIPGLRAMTMPLAGSARMSWCRFLLYDAAGVVLWVLAYVLLGAVSAPRWPGLVAAVQSYRTTFLLILGAALAALLGLRAWRRLRHGPAFLGESGMNAP